MPIAASARVFAGFDPGQGGVSSRMAFCEDKWAPHKIGKRDIDLNGGALVA
jgi:hypothetical protein